MGDLHFRALRARLVSLVLLALVAGCTTSRLPAFEDTGGPVDAGFTPVDVGTDAPVVCMPGTINCGGTCTRVAGDPLNCGSCGNACPTGVGCAVGACTCNLPKIACEGVCLDPAVDPLNCGSCGNVCGPTEMCTDGVCLVMCTAPNQICRDAAGTVVCADLQTDPVNCGHCNTRCAGGSVCAGGRCSCPAGTVACAGACVDTATDSNNCGVCGVSCGTGGICSGGFCTSCGTDRINCSGVCVDVMADRFNCGSCGRACGTGESCSGGLCSCIAGRVDCGAGCIDPLTDPANCGTCGTNCGPGGVCVAGACTCAVGLTLCSGSCVDTATDFANCGGCGMACPPVTFGVCSGSVCGCPAGMTQCGSACINPQTDASNCGGCGNVCPGTQVCLLGACSIAPPTRYVQSTPAAGTVPWIDACAAPGSLVVLPTADDQSSLQPLPFPFRYWATDLAVGAMVNICSNGWMSMDGVANSSLGGTVPNATTPNAVIAPHWGDNYTRTGICVATVGTAPNRQFVVEWNDTYYFGGTATGGVHNTFEVVLSEGTGTIDIIYNTMTMARAQTMGLEDQTGANGINACPGGTGTCIPTAGQVVRFLPSL